MNTVFMVMPILNLLMFQLGLDFEALRKVAWILGRLFGTSSPPSLPHKEDITVQCQEVGHIPDLKNGL